SKPTYGYLELQSRQAKIAGPSSAIGQPRKVLGGVCRSDQLETRNYWFLVRQSVIVNVEIRIEDGLALRAEEGRLRLDPFARLLLFRVSHQTCLLIGGNLRKLIGNVILLTWILRQIEQLGLARKQRNLDQLPIAFADGGAESF